MGNFENAKVKVAQGWLQGYTEGALKIFKGIPYAAPPVGALRFRLRDNGVRFDPVRYMELHKEDDPSRGLGIRMVMKMVREANYIHSLGLNNLTLIL